VLGIVRRSLGVLATVMIRPLPPPWTGQLVAKRVAIAGLLAPPAGLPCGGDHRLELCVFDARTPRFGRRISFGVHESDPKGSLWYCQPRRMPTERVGFALWLARRPLKRQTPRKHGAQAKYRYRDSKRDEPRSAIPLLEPNPARVQG
jgi:hypothetical protein